eukprot:CAMPEP_0194522492 /NCGR_PEP_ID=MMETSP0253-20130528/57086_1 /TAXON_ID=2966 /ORGANISM="Noctiluca scintillans" /LENGTH=103 /DNA_ID=CAMNT_0039366931 /DNA_START=143 /DNA_END=452 /DNA_ORIENTATION=-
MRGANSGSVLRFLAIARHSIPGDGSRMSPIVAHPTKSGSSIQAQDEGSHAERPASASSFLDASPSQKVEANRWNNQNIENQAIALPTNEEQIRKKMCSSKVSL